MINLYLFCMVFLLNFFFCSNFSGMELDVKAGTGRKTT